ncbi:MAG: hypothetical protein MMC33_010216 [Icmadophila ericetorum]|nr:hypothetical protein [Icmadophila ericetorum]
MATIAGVTGAQYLRGTPEYPDERYQYATSTHGVDHDMNPALIVQPLNKDDIALVLQYAKANNIAVATRTGGHQYSGASSTAAPNIQLDLNTTFQGPDDRVIFEKGDKTFLRTSISWSLGDFNAYLGKNNVFLPHGQCTHVHIGGHVQTGGYGQLGRSFGLLGDYVLSLEIVDYDGNIKEITKKSNSELFYAFLGGSPGNLGVLTHLTLEVNRNSDYQGSRGMKVLYLYNVDILKRLLTILAKMSDDPDVPRNYDFCVSVLSSSFRLSDLWHKPDLDEKMKLEHPELYGPDGNPFWPRSIIVYAQWVPFSKNDVYDPKWFDQFRKDAFLIDGGDPEPMSTLTAQWIFRNTREFKHPYVKRTYATKSTTLVQDGWVDWVAERIDTLVRPDNNGLWLSAQLQCFGGKFSKFTTNANNGTSYSWRDSTLVCTLDCFYDETDPDALNRAQDWQRGNDEEGVGPNGIFSKQDRRVLWGSYGSYDLDSVWMCYYEDREKYERLGKTRAVADPYGTFTPNTFAVKRLT